MHIRQRAHRVRGVAVFAGLLVLVALGWLVVVLVTKGVALANQWAGLLGTGVALTGVLVTLVKWWLKKRVLTDQFVQTYPGLRVFGANTAQKLTDQGRLLPVLGGLDEISAERSEEAAVVIKPEPLAARRARKIEGLRQKSDPSRTRLLSCLAGRQRRTLTTICDIILILIGAFGGVFSVDFFSARVYHVLDTQAQYSDTLRGGYWQGVAGSFDNFHDISGNSWFGGFFGAVLGLLVGCGVAAISCLVIRLIGGKSTNPASLGIFGILAVSGFCLGGLAGDGHLGMIVVSLGNGGFMGTFAGFILGFASLMSTLDLLCYVGFDDDFFVFLICMPISMDIILDSYCGANGYTGVVIGRAITVSLASVVGGAIGGSGTFRIIQIIRFRRSAAHDC